MTRWLLIGGVAGLLALSCTRARATSPAPLPVDQTPAPAIEPRELCTVVRETLAKPAIGPLPDGRELAEWVEAVETSAVAVAALEAASAKDSKECLQSLLDTVRLSKLPPKDMLRFRAESAAWRFLTPREPPPERDLGRPAMPAAFGVSRDGKKWSPEPTDRLAWVRFLTTGADNGSDAGCGMALEDRLQPAGSNDRLRSALYGYLFGCPGCGLDRRDGPADHGEPWLRLIWRAAPARVPGLMELGLRPKERGYGIPGDNGLTGSVLQVFRELAPGHPEVTAELAAVAEKGAFQNARWGALAAYLRAGAPDGSRLAEALRGEPAARRWALAWVTSETVGVKPPELSSADIAALEQATAQVTTIPDQHLALAALEWVPPGTGVPVIAQGLASANESVHGVALQALAAQVNRSPLPTTGMVLRDDRSRSLDGKPQGPAPNARAFREDLPVLRRALLPGACLDQRVLMLLAQLGDERADETAAQCIREALEKKTETTWPIQMAQYACPFRTYAWTVTARAIYAAMPKTSNARWAGDVAALCGTGPLRSGEHYATADEQSVTAYSGPPLIADTEVATIAGVDKRGQTDGTGGPLGEAMLDSPMGLAVDTSGVVHIASRAAIRRVYPSGMVTTLAGGARVSADDGTGGKFGTAGFSMPEQLAFDPQGTLYVSDRGNGRIRRVATNGDTTTLAISGGQPIGPAGIAVDRRGNVFVVDVRTRSIRRITPTGSMTTFAGGGMEQMADGTGGEHGTARFVSPQGLAFDAGGNLLVTDYGRLRKVDPDGNVTTVAGSESASKAVAGTPQSLPVGISVAVDREGNIYTARDARVWRLGTDGHVTAIAGTETEGDADGSAGPDGDARLRGPTGLAFDDKGNLYVSEPGMHRVRRIAAAAVHR